MRYYPVVLFCIFVSGFSYGQSDEFLEMKALAESGDIEGLKVNIDQDGAGIDQIQAFRNMDRSNANDYRYDSIRTYDRCNGYLNRMNIYNEWLQQQY